MKKSLAQLLIVCTLCTLLFSLSSCTLFKKSSRARVKTLMITGNFMEPRLLVELAQYRSKQPIILVHQDADNNATRLFYLTGNEKEEEIPTDKFVEFVQYLNPKSVVFLGDEVCVPPTFEEQIRDKFRVMTINSKDWELNAQMLGDLMDQPTLSREFKNFRQRFLENTKPASEK